MTAVALIDPGEARLIETSEPLRLDGELLLKVDMVGLCGTDLSSFYGRNALITYPPIIGHEIAATLVEGLALGTGRNTRNGVSLYELRGLRLL